MLYAVCQNVPLLTVSIYNHFKYTHISITTDSAHCLSDLEARCPPKKWRTGTSQSLVEALQWFKNTETLLATLPDVWHHRVSTRTVWPEASLLSLDKIASLIFTIYLSVSARTNFSCLCRFIPRMHIECCWVSTQQKKPKTSIYLAELFKILVLHEIRHMLQQYKTNEAFSVCIHINWQMSVKNPFVRVW